MPFQTVIAALVSAVIFALVGLFLGITYRKRVAEREISSAEEEARRIVNDAFKNAENKKRELLLEAKEEIHKDRVEYEQEVKNRRSELSKQEQRLQQKDENLDRKVESLEQKNENLNKKLSEVEKTLAEAAGLKDIQLKKLEEIANYTAEEAKHHLISTLESEVTYELAQTLKNLEAHYKEEAEQKAREYITVAIQRCAADHVAEAAVSVVPLPSDEMKGRIIGREGRNIRTIETLTGVDLIIDDTPEAITLSSFDPVRREVARIALEKLILDGRIHPARIEETIVKARREVDNIIRSEGERAAFETGIHGLHPEIIKLLGRQKYRTSYGQNVLSHSIEVSHISGLLAAELGADVATAKRAGLLHDLGKSIDHEVEGSHVTIGVELAKKYKESADVIHAIEAHHGDVEATTAIACIVQAADTISAARPGARRENIESYIKRLEKLEEVTSSFHGVESSFAIQAGREVRVIVKPEEVTEDQMILLSRDIARKIESELKYPGLIKVHLLRETKAIEYAK